MLEHLLIQWSNIWQQLGPSTASLMVVACGSNSMKYEAYKQ